ncbi:MAG: hypothetical protein H6922_00365 [Pseudomonadaceae bacterium]|nr:hypothetical protein [Pseudomonadaceae bacterium]
MKHAAFLCLLLVSAVARAQVMPASIPVEAEALAPVSVTQPPPPVAPFMVKDVQITLEEAEGFNRDAALIAAARMALPSALAQLAVPMSADKAEGIANSVGDPMQFVKSYKIIKEVLVPSYTLTVDLAFNGDKLQSNFGAVVPVAEEPMAGDVAVVSETGGLEQPVPPVRQSLRVEIAGAGAQDALLAKLAAAGLQPQWEMLARDGGRIGVATPLDAQGLWKKLNDMGLHAAMDGETLVLTE